jgi:Holliday junction resolvase
MSGRRSRDKGNRAERGLVRFLQDAGFAAERIPLSGAAGGSFAGDVTLPVFGDDWTIEVKCRARGFAQLYQWLGSNDALVVRADREPMLVVLRLSKAVTLLRRAEEYRTRGRP